MALEKQLCCFGVVLVVLLMGTLSSAQIQKLNESPRKWTPSGGIGKGVIYPVQKPQAPQKIPQMTSPVNPPPKVSQKQNVLVPSQICNVEEYDRVPCGEPGISAGACQNIGCCSNGAQCFHGKTVTLYCTWDAQFIIVVSKDVTTPRLNLNTVTLLGGAGDPACNPVDSNSGFVIYQFPATSCGTTMREEQGYVIYENQMASYYELCVGEFGTITRDSQFQLAVQCRYYGMAVEALVVEVLPVPPPLPEAGTGPFRVELRLGNGVCTTKGCVEEAVAYTSYYQPSDYPVSKILRDPVYVEVRMLERTDPNIVLTLGRCWATTTSNPDTLPQWDLLIDGCPYKDECYLTTLVPILTDVEHPTHYRRFILKMFTFVDQKFLTPLQETSVYIHCKASVCKPTAADSCEPRCEPRYRRDLYVEQQEEAKETVVVSSGKLIFKT